MSTRKNVDWVTQEDGAYSTSIPQDTGLGRLRMLDHDQGGEGLTDLGM